MPQTIEIFSKSLKDTDIMKRLAIPAKALPSFPNFNGSHALEIHLTYGTRVWPIVYSIRKKGYKKPVFSGGWRNFVLQNNFNVGDKLTLYKVLDEDGSLIHYKVEVKKQARAFESDFSSVALSLNCEADHDETIGTSRAKVRKQEQLSTRDDIASINEKEAIMMRLVDIATDYAAPVAFVDHVIAKRCSWMSDEVTSKAQIKTQVLKTQIGVVGLTKDICMVGEPRWLTEEREIKSFGLIESGANAMAYGTINSQGQAAGETYYKDPTESLGLDFVLKQPIPNYVGKLNLDLTLAPPHVDQISENHGSYCDSEESYI